MARRRSSCLKPGLAWLGTLLPLAGLAQTPPGAGQLLQQLTPPPGLPGGQARPTVVEESPVAPSAEGERFVLKALRWSGNTVFTPQELAVFAQDMRDQAVGLADLERLTQRVSRHYRQAGYLVARAYLPPQEIRDGVVHIAVLEGQLGRIELSGTAPLAANALAPAGRLQPGDRVQAQALEGVLLRLADLPGVEVRSTLRPGATVGASDFLVEIAPGARFAGTVDADSFGNRYTGTHRLGTTLHWNNPAQLGDQLSLRAQVSEDHFGYARLGYQLPLGPQATRVGVAWSRLSYRLGKDLLSLGGSGEAGVASLYLQHPLLRSRTASWFATLQYDDKTLVDRMTSAGLRTDKSLRNWTVGLNGQFIDGLASGSNSASLQYTQGRLAMDAASAAIDAASAKTAGRFGKWALSYRRLQPLPGDWSLLAGLQAQWASKNLDPAEKMSLGGVTGVRAYPQGEASGDRGALFHLDLQYALGREWRVSGFYDRGHLRINESPWAPGVSNRRRLAGYGLGLAYANAIGFSASLQAAWKTGSEEGRARGDHGPRIWAQAQYQF